MKLTKNFYLWEFISPGIWRTRREKALWLLDKPTILIVQKLRTRIGKGITCCNWHDPIDGYPIYKYSGYRSPSCKIGAKLSDHRIAKSVDLKILGLPNRGADILRDEIITNYKSIYQPMGLTVIEHEDFAVNWCHLSTRWTGLNTLSIIKP